MPFIERLLTDLEIVLFAVESLPSPLSLSPVITVPVS